MDGVELQQGGSSTFDHVFTQARNYSVSVTASMPASCSGGPSSATATLSTSRSMKECPAPSAWSPDPARPNEAASLSVVPTGGSAPYTYAWDADDDGDFDDGTTRTISTTFPANGTYTVRVKIRDSANPPHDGLVTRTITVSDAEPPPPPPPPCTKKLAFGLSEFTTDGCFTQIGAIPSAQWVTTDQVKLNGISFSDLGQRFVVTFPTPGEPGGHISTPNGAIQFDQFVAYSGPIDWSLPAGGQGESGILHTVTAPSFAKLFQLHVTGSIAIKIGWAADGKHYGVLPLTIELPAIFKPAPDPSSKAITGTASLRVDETGPRYDGLKINVTDSWIGRIKVPGGLLLLRTGGW